MEKKEQLTFSLGQGTVQLTWANVHVRSEGRDVDLGKYLELFVLHPHREAIASDNIYMGQDNVNETS